MVITDSFHSDIEGKNYKFGTPNKLNKTSKPLILFYFVQDYKRTWDEANPLNYDDPQLKNDAIVTKIESEGDVLNISLFDYESLDETELRFEVGKETSISKVVDENDHTKEYKFIPTKIVVDDSLEKGSKIYDELIETVWTNYYIKNSKEGEKIPKVAENVENLAAEGHSHNKSSYKKCAECSDSVFELEEEICFECSSFGAETFGVDVIHRKDGIEVGDNSIANEYQCGECDSVYDNSSDATICCKCSSCDEPIHEGYCIKNAETFEADPEYEGLNHHGDLPFKEMDKIYKDARKERKYNMNHPKDGSKVPLSRRKDWELIESDTVDDGGDLLIVSALYEDKSSRNKFYGLTFYFDLTNHTSPYKINPNDENSYGWDYYKNFNLDPVNPRGYASLIIADGEEEGRIISSHPFKEMNAETFEANAKTGNKVYIITRRSEDYSAYRELDVAGFGSLTEARKKFNILFNDKRKLFYADETIADAKDYMSWGEYGGIMSFYGGEMIYELREVIVGDKGDFYFDAEGEINDK